jgi:RNA polymerase sigma-70 factor, ECF subfamily
VDPGRPRAAVRPPPEAAAVPAHDNERELIAAVLRKDRKAAASFVAAHIDAVYGYVRQRLSPRTDLVDDVVQEVFLAALNGLATFQGQSSLRTWLFGIARHKVEDVYRQRLRVTAGLDDGEGVGEHLLAVMAAPEEQMDIARVRARTRTVLARMPEQYGLMLLWRYWEQRSTKEMAAALATTEKSVERTLSRARARFKELWSKEEPDGR